MLEFTYKNIERCFEDETIKSELDHFFSRYFTRILTTGLWLKAEQCTDISEITNKSNFQNPHQFENLLPASFLLTLPPDAQMQIDDALSELEASDYRDWVYVYIE